MFGKAVFYAFISYAKAVSEKNKENQQKILNALYRSSNPLPKQTNLKKEDLKVFSEHLTKSIDLKKAG